MQTRTTLQAARIRRSAAQRAALHLKTLEPPLKSATAHKSRYTLIAPTALSVVIYDSVTLHSTLKPPRRSPREVVLGPLAIRAFPPPRLEMGRGRLGLN